MNRLRLFAYLTAVPSIVGVVLLARGVDFTVALLWLLIPALLAGLVLSLRFYPLDLVGAKATARLNSLWKLTFIDIGLLSLGYLVLLLGGAVATQFTDPDLSAFGLAPLLAVFCGGAVLLGTALGILVVLPVLTLIEQSKLATRPGAVNRGAVAGAFLLLSVVVLVVSMVAASSIDSGGSARSRGFTALFVTITGIQAEDARITSEPLAWVARIALATLIVSGIALYRLSRGHPGQNL